MTFKFDLAKLRSKEQLVAFLGIEEAVFEEVVNFDPGISRSADLSGEAFLSARSEEHTSELQSLMRISYAVFCLKKINVLEAIKLYRIDTPMIFIHTQLTYSNFVFTDYDTKTTTTLPLYSIPL